ncbi:MAG: MBL fold metallo-hydrolase [Candidatus Babeliaceae bacterium]
MSLHKLYPSIRDGRFTNYPGELHRSFFLHSLLMVFQSWMTRRPHAMDNWKIPYTAQIPQFEQALITWIGHSSFLIQLQGLTVLTDPVFYDLSFLFKRVVPPGISGELLPPIDLVIISHNHRDHMDEKSLLLLKKLNPQLKVLVPQGNKKWFDRRGFADVQECMWWDEIIIKKEEKSYQFVFLPAFHWSQRGLFDRNKTLWGSWLIRSFSPNLTLYFAGDTAYGNHFKAISKEFSAIDIALMPIGPCEPHQWMQFAHVNAEQAGQGFLDLGAQHFVPMHWGTFYFGIDQVFQPLQRLQSWWQLQIDPAFHHLHCLKIGQTLPIKTRQAEEVIISESIIQTI